MPNNKKPRRVVLPSNLTQEQREFSVHLLEWGIDEGNLRDHRKFASISRGIVQNALKNATALERMVHAPQRLPNDAEKASRIILQCSIRERSEKRCRTIEDTITGNNSRSPYNVYPSKNPFEKDVVYVKKKWAYENLSKLDLDPLDRFSATPLSKREDFKEWLTCPEAALGLFYEALVAVQAIHNEACVNCLGRRCLLWNGGPNVSWADLVCSNCDSTYEIKSKIDMEAIERSNTHNLFGGDFLNYLSLCSEPRKAGWKRYLVEVSRKVSSTRLGSPGSSSQQDWNWIVQIGPISRVLPILSPSCFVDGRKMRPKAKVILQTPTRFWFRVPYVSLPYEDIVSELLEEEFPGITEEVNTVKKKASDEEDTRAAKQSASCPSDAVDVNALKKELESDHDVDDWEDLVDDE